jgi:hypothetical protein
MTLISFLELRYGLLEELIYATDIILWDELICAKFSLLYITCSCVWINLLLDVHGG